MTQRPDSDMFVEIVIRFPDQMEPTRYSLPIPYEVFHESFEKLPRDRELPWAIREQERALAMHRMRERVAAAIAQRLASKIMDLAKARDTVNGYPPDPAEIPFVEWQQLEAPIRESFCKCPKCGTRRPA